MRTPSRLRLALPIAVLVALAAVLTGACSTFSPPAWQVGDVSMSVDEFYAAFQADQGSSSTTTTAGERVPTADLASFMTGLIQEQLQTQFQDEILPKGLEQKGITLTDDDLAAARQAAAGQSQTGAPTDDQVRLQAGVTALSKRLAEDAVALGFLDLDAAARDLYEANKQQLITPGETCAHFILIPAGDLENATSAPDEAAYQAARTEAEQVLPRLATEDWAAVSAEVSAIDEQVPGGDFGCQPMSSYPTEVAPIVEDLDVGEIGGPTRIQGGYLITRVDSRTEDSEPPPFEDVEQEARDAVLQREGQRLLEEWFRTEARHVYVAVDPRFGTWNVDKVAVDPPAGAATPSVPTTEFNPVGIDPSTIDPQLDPSQVGQ